MNNQIIELMRDKAIKAMRNAYNPYSNFFVGACILADDDNYYVGCNIENVSYRMTICAEQCAVGNMLANGAKRIKEMVIVADSEKIIAPCGACRQVISEFTDATTKVHMFNKDGAIKTRTMAELLPEAFDTEFLEQY